MAGACGARFSEGDRLASFVLRAAACSAAFLPLNPSSVSDGPTRPMAADEVTCLVFRLAAVRSFSTLVSERGEKSTLRTTYPDPLRLVTYPSVKSCV